MPLSYVNYTANGSTTQFDITFTYIDQSHVKVYIAGTQDTNFTFVNSSRIQTSSTPANGAVVKIDRDTPTDARLVDFSDGAVLSETDLDKSANQNFFSVQETIDTVADKLGKATDGIYDAGSIRIKNVANPTSNQDAVTKIYLSDTFLTDANKTALTTVNSNISNINAVNSNSSNINSAVSNASNINTVAGNNSNITTVAGISANVTTVAGNNSNVTTVAGANSNIATVASNIASVNTVAGDITKVIAVANDLAEAVSEVETVADDLNEATSEINTVAVNIANVNTVGGISSNVTTVAGISGNVTTVAGISSAVTGVNNISSAVSAVNSNASNINAVNSNSSNINTVAGNNSNINTVAGVSSNVTTVAGISSAVSTVSSNNANVSTVASNISGVNSFADRYRIASSDPSSSLDEGDLVYNSTDNQVKFYNGSSWVAISADTDVKTKVSSNDTTAGFLNGKLVAGSNITFTENNNGGNETLSIASTDNSIPFAIALG